MTRLAALEPANCNALECSDSERPTMVMPGCPEADFAVPPMDRHLTPLDAVESDYMVRDNYVALVLHTESTFDARSRARRDTTAGSGVRRKRSR